MSESPGSPAPSLPRQTSHKAWAAGLGATLLPLAAQALLSSGAAGRVIAHWGICGIVGSECPAPATVADAMVTILSAVIGGLATGITTYYVTNKPKVLTP